MRYIYQDNSGGCSSPRNHGIRQSAGSLVTVFDADDLMEPDKIASQVEFLGRHADVDVVFGDYVNFSEDGVSRKTHFQSCHQLLEKFRNGGVERREVVLRSEEACRILLKENFGGACSPLFRRSVFNRVGGYDETLRGSEDFEFHYRVARLFSIGVVNRVVFHRRLHGGNMSENTPNILRYKIASRKMLLQQETNSDVRRYLREWIRRRYLEIGRYYMGNNLAKSLQATFLSLRYGWVVDRYFLTTVAKAVLGVGNGEPKGVNRPSSSDDVPAASVLDNKNVYVMCPKKVWLEKVPLRTTPTFSREKSSGIANADAGDARRYRDEWRDGA